MGPFRLNSLMEKTGAIEHINLKDAANDWRSKGGEPTIVLDCLNFARKFYDPDEKGGSDVICNGEYKKIAQNMKTFIQAFKDISIELVFFFDGPADETKLETWIQRRQKRLAENLNTFNCIESSPMSQFKVDAFPCMILPVMKEVLKEEKVTIVRGVDDHDKEMAKYAVDNKCLGILSDDTDFVVFDGIPYVFSARGRCLNIQNMKSSVYRRQKFLSGIKLNSKAMPIFATLLGNDYIKKEDAQEYSKRKYKAVFLKPRNVEDLAKVANHILAESKSMEEMAERLANEMKYDTKVILDSLRSYDLNIGVSTNDDSPTGSSQWDSVLALCLKKFREGYIENQTLSIVKRQLCTQSEKFEDPRNSHVDTLQGLRQRIYSILLHEKSSCGDKVTVTEILAGGSKSMEPHPVQLLKVEVEHPGILKLWNSGDEFDNKRWALIWWAVCSDRPSETVISFEAVSHLRDLPDHLMIVGLALLYLDKVVKQLSEQERVVLMVLATSVPHMDVAQLSENRVECTKKRAVNLATLYMQTYVYVRWIMDVCGLRLTAKTRDAYSGQLFHYLFQLNDPEQFFDVSGKEARKNYDELRNALDKASNKANQQDETRQPVPTENPGISDQDDPTKQGEVEDNRREEGRGEDYRREGRKAGDSRRRRESSEERRGRRRHESRENQRQSREDSFCERRHLEERHRNYSRGSAPNRRQPWFNNGRRGQNYNYWGSDRFRHPQNQRRNHRGFFRHSSDRRYNY